MTVVALVPSKDRALSTARTVETLLAVPGVDRVVVVDDGSSDATADAAQRAGARVVRLGLNRGKAGAVAAGIEAEPDADVYLLIDADVGEDARHAATLLAPVLTDEADLVVGVLPAAAGRGGFGTVRRLAHWGVQRGCGFDAAAPLSGQRAIRGSFLRDMQGSPRFGLEVAMTVDAVRGGARVQEVEVPMEHLHTGRTVSGFRHRASQGWDVIRALWPRLVPVWLRRVGLIAIVVALLALSLGSTRAGRVVGAPLDQRVRHVVILGVPHLGLDDLETGTMPNLDRLVGSGAVGMMTVATGGGSSGAPVYGTLGAGDQVTVLSTPGQVADRRARVEGSPAIDVLERRSGRRPAGRVLVLGMPAARRANATLANSLPGSLGDALGAVGLGTAVIANSDTIDSNGQVVSDAPAAWAASSSAGAVTRGTVARGLTRADPTWPFGMRADRAAFIRAFDQVSAASGLVVVDTGDTDRAAAYASGMLPSQADAARLRALAATDQVLGSLQRHLQPDTLLIVAGTSSPSGQAQLLPIVLSGSGIPAGRLESPSTSRPGLVTLTDVAPTVLSALGTPVPPAMIGRPLRVTAGPVDIGALRSANDAVVARARAYPGFLKSFIWVQVILYVLATVALLQRATPDGAKRFLRFMLVSVTLVPLLTFVLRGVPPVASLGGGAVVVLYVVAALVGWLIHDRGRTPWGPLVAVCAANFVLLSCDLALRAPLQEASLLGYSPTSAARFTGVGNGTFGILAASVLILMGWLVGRASRPRDAWWIALAVGVIGIAVDGAPWLGSDVGGILSLVPAVAVLALLLWGRRIDWKMIVFPVFAAVAMLGAVIAYEAFQPAAGRDHIGRFFLGGGEGGTSSTTVLRKMAVNMSLFGSSTWTRLVIIVPLFVAILYLFGRCWDAVAPRGSWRRHVLISLAVVAVLGYAVNDSGVLAAALVFVYLGPFVALPALSARRESVEILEPLESTAEGTILERAPS